MTLATGWKTQYEGNDSATHFSFPYYFKEDVDLQVIHRSTAGVETVLTSGVDYTVTGEDSLNGDVEFPTGGSFSTLATGERITTTRIKSVTEDTDLSGAYQWDTLNDSKDDAMMVSQQQQDEIDRSLKQPASDSDTLSMTIPNSIDRASKTFVWKANGEPDAGVIVTNTITSGGGPPSSTPASLGDTYIDTTNNVAYAATGTASSADWKVTTLVTSQAGAPSSTPSRLGLTNIDTTNGIVYTAIGTSTSDDWLPLTVQSTFGFIIDGSGSAIVAGKKNYVGKISRKCEIYGVTTIAMVDGVETAQSIKLQLLVNGSNVSASDPLFLDAAAEENKTSFSGWTLAIPKDSKVQIEVLSSPVPDAEYVAITFQCKNKN